ncbi:MAG: AAA family ATPase [Candidatus Sulfobium sp.]
MYTEYFGLRESPFSIAPDPRYLFMSGKHREALAHLIYGIRGDGFILLTGEVGTGKTTVCRCLLEQLPENTDIAFVLYPKLTVRELLATICDELRIGYKRANASNKDLLDRINAHLLAAHARGRKTVLIIEEAQNLSTELLEQVRLLTNLETDSRKLLQIIMVGQPELRDVLERSDMRQVAQRITARYHLGPLSREEVAAYVSHRLAVAGGRPELFPPRTVKRIFRLSGGIPRLINLLCDRSLLGAYSQGRKAIDSPTVSTAWREISGGQREAPSPAKGLRFAIGVMVLVICGAVVAAVYYARMAQSDDSERAVQIQKIKPGKIHTEPATLEWPAAQPVEESEDMAYRTLFGEWGASYGGGGPSACRGVVPDGLQCLQDLGGMNTLMRLNRPAVLTLFDSRGRKYYAALISVQGDKATFRLGSETRKVDIHRIERWWFGDFSVLWRTPPDYRGDIRPGDSGQTVKWLGRQLSGIDGAGVEPFNDLVYNKEMVKQVKKFQLANGLNPDGIVGPRTVILLNSRSGETTPRLNGAGGGE